MNILLTIAYLGTRYCGWQVQQNGVSVQQALQDAVEKVFGSRFPVTGCSRTDSGVHADEFLCSVLTDGSENPVPPERIPLAMNAVLAPDIAVLGCEIAPDSFHPRYDIAGKEYRYLIYDRRTRDPFLEGRAFHCFSPLDARAMDMAARSFEGEHDFTSFYAQGGKEPDPVRTVFGARVRREGGTVIYTVSANGFLYNMVRIMAGTLIEVGCGKRPPDGIAPALEARSRDAAGQTAPACGLYLHRIIRKAPLSED